jgi:hypothetical protein
MYAIFDEFLSSSTWHTHRDLDEGRFFEALIKVVDDPDFSPDAMRSYFMARGDNLAMQDAVNEYAIQAWAIKDFLAKTGR